jgi:MSHA biogenesis protein MshO
MKSRRMTFPRGVTLIEMIVVIAITGAIAAGVALFVRRPVEQYVDSARRAELTDLADTALRRLTRDLRTALPNSIRVTVVGSAAYLEYLETRAGGRYRGEVPDAPVASGATTCPDLAPTDGFADENVLRFGAADTCFGAVGGLANLAGVAAGSDYVVVYNLGPGNTSADAYETGAATGGNKARITTATAGAGSEDVIRFSSNTFTFGSPGKRFHVVTGPVTYACDPTLRQLRRISGYAIQSAQPTDINAAPLSTATVKALLAQNVNTCSSIFTYDTSAVDQRTGVVGLSLAIADPSAPSEVVRLFHQVHVNNAP